MNPFDVVQKLYLAIYDRPADWAGLRFWADQLESQGLAAVFEAFAESPEFEQMYGGLTPEAQITKLYENLLDRTPDAEGLVYWASSIYRGASPADITMEFLESAQEDDRTAIDALLQEANKATYGYLVDMLYAGYYNRTPDAEGRAFWIESLVNSDGEVDSIVQAFGYSQEYFDRYSGMTATEQVNALYQSLFSRDAESKGAAFWTAKLESGELDLSSIAFALIEGASEQDRDAVDQKVSDLQQPEPTPEPEPTPAPTPAPTPTPPAPEPEPTPTPIPTPEPEPEPFQWKVMASFNHRDEKISPFITDGTPSGTTYVPGQELPLVYNQGPSPQWVANESGFATYTNIFRMESYGDYKIYAAGGWISDGTVSGTQKLPVDDLVYGADAHLALGEFNVAIGPSGFYAGASDLNNEIGSLALPAATQPLSASGYSPGGYILSKDNDLVWYAGHSSPYGSELYALKVSQGKVESTRLTDIRPGGDSGVSKLTDVAFTKTGELLFLAQTTDNSWMSGQIWISDGTQEGTLMLMDLDTNAPHSYNYVQTMFNGGAQGETTLVVYNHQGAISFNELDVTNKTFLPIVEDLSAFAHLGSINDDVYFIGSKGENSTFYRYGANNILEQLGSVPTDAELIDWESDAAYFLDSDSLHGREVFALDFGSKEYDIYVDLLPGSGSGSPTDLYSAAYFSSGSLITSHYVDDINVSTSISHESGSYETLFEGKVTHFKEISSGVLAFTEGDRGNPNGEVWFVQASDEGPIVSELISSTFSYWSENSQYAIGQDALFYLERGETDQLKKFSTQSLGTEIILEGDIHQFKVIDDLNVLISELDGDLHYYGETDGLISTRLVDSFEDGVVDLIGAAVLNSAPDLLV